MQICYFSLLVIFFKSFGSSQVISSPRPQPYPLHAEKTNSCCLFQNSHNELMNCINKVATAITASSQNQKKDLLSLSNSIKTHPVAAVVTYVTKSIYEYAAYALAINSAYAEHNSYLYQILTQKDAAYEPTDARWNKVKILENAIDGWAKDVSYVVWVDADLAILDLGMKIELIGEKYPHADLIMSEDLDSASTLANSGYILIRNTPWIKDFLIKWWSYDRTRMNDQAALTMLYHTLSPEEKAKIIILPKDAVNSHFPPHLHQRDHNQVLHLAGDIQAYRKQIFQKGFHEICFSLQNFTSQSPLPLQLSLSRDYLATSTSQMKGVRITELQKLKSSLNYLPPGQASSAKEHYSFIESILNKALDLQKGALEEFSERGSGSEKLRQLKMEFYSLEVELLYWCYQNYKDLTLAINSSVPYPSATQPNSGGDRKRNSEEEEEVIRIQNHHHAEALRQTMSIAYFFVDFHSTYSRELFHSDTNSDSSTSDSGSLSIDELQITSTSILKEVLNELKQIILPELQHRLPPSDYSRGKYYEFKLYQFMTGVYSSAAYSATGGEGQDKDQEEKDKDLYELIALYKKAIEVWREMHRLEYYGTTYLTIDPYKEGSRTMKYLGGLLCFETHDMAFFEEGISYYREAQHLMELTIKGFEGNFLANDYARVDERFVLARLHGEVGSCLTYFGTAEKLEAALREYQIALNYFDEIEQIEKTHKLSPEMKHFQSNLLNLIRQFSNDLRLLSNGRHQKENQLSNSNQQTPLSHEHEDSSKHKTSEVEVDPIQGEGISSQNQKKRVFRRKSKN